MLYENEKKTKTAIAPFEAIAVLLYNGFSTNQFSIPFEE